MEVEIGNLSWTDREVCCSLDRFLCSHLKILTAQAQPQLWGPVRLDTALQPGSGRGSEFWSCFLCSLCWPEPALTPTSGQGPGVGQKLSHLVTVIYREAWDCIKGRNHKAEPLLSFFYLLLWDRPLWTSSEPASSLWGEKVIFYHRVSNQGGKVVYNGGVFALLSASQQFLRQSYSSGSIKSCHRI